MLFTIDFEFRLEAVFRSGIPLRLLPIPNTLPIFRILFKSSLLVLLIPNSEFTKTLVSGYSYSMSCIPQQALVGFDPKRKLPMRPFSRNDQLSTFAARAPATETAVRNHVPVMISPHDAMERFTASSILHVFGLLIM
jgi:hypothetical protein